MSVASIIQEVAAIQGQSATLTALGLKRAFADAPESLPELPCIVNVPGKAKRAWPATSGLRSVEHEIHMQLFMGRSDLPTADKAAKQWITAMMDLFDQNVTLGGNVTMAGVTAYEYGKLAYGAVEYLGVDCTLTASERTQVAYHA